MSPLEQYRALARHNRWLNRKLFRLAFTLDDATLKRQLGATFGRRLDPRALRALIVVVGLTALLRLL